jgi:hypothetical protein
MASAIDVFGFRLVSGNYRKFFCLQAKVDSIPIGPRLPQTPAASS